MHPSTVSLGPAGKFAEAISPIGLTKSYGVLLHLHRLLTTAGKPSIMHHRMPGWQV